MELSLMIILSIIGSLVIFILNYFLIRSIYQEFKKLQDKEYIKKTMHGGRWMGRKINKQFKNDMMHVCGVIGFGALIASFSIYLNYGFILMFSGALCVSIMMLYAAFIWDKYLERKKNTCHSRHNIEITRHFYEAMFILFLGFIFYTMINDNPIESLIFRLFLIIFPFIIIAANEFHYYLVKKK